MRRIPIQERRARLGLKHHLAAGALAGDAVDAAEDLVGLHATDPASVFLAASARIREPSIGAVERALYDDRTLVRVLGMRRTMFTLPVELAAVVQSACTRAIALRERRRLVEFIAQSEIAKDPGRWLRRLERDTLAALAERGEATAAEVCEDVPRLRTQIVLGRGTKWETKQAASSRVLFLLAADGSIVRTRPRGSWTSSQYRWAPIESWLGTGFPAWPLAEAQAELARRWLLAFGPATVADLRWWTGWTGAEAKRALARSHPVEVELDSGTGVVAPGDAELPAAVDPWVALLPALDPTVMGWKSREWYLGEHGPALFDRSGNAGPTIWCDGRIVGGWAQRADGEVVWRLLEDLGADAAAAVGRAAERVTALLREGRVTPRFRTPLERELVA